MDSACWWFRRANKLATIRWGETRGDIEEAVKEFEEKAFAEQALIEKKALEILGSGDADGLAAMKKFLTTYTNDFARAAMNKYLELGDKFWTKFARGF